MKVLPARISAIVQGQLFGPITRRPGHIHLPVGGHLEFLRARSTIKSTKAYREISYAPQYDLAAGMMPTARYLEDRKRKEG